MPWRSAYRTPYEMKQWHFSHFIPQFHIHYDIDELIQCTSNYELAILILGNVHCSLYLDSEIMYMYMIFKFNIDPDRKYVLVCGNEYREPYREPLSSARGTFWSDQFFPSNIS